MKNKSTLLLIGILMLLAGLSGYNYFVRPFAKLAVNQVKEIDISSSPEPSLSEVDKQIQELTNTQKITQLIAAPLTIDSTRNDSGPASDSANMIWIKEHQPGLVTLFGQGIDSATAAEAVAKLKQSRSLSSPVWVAVDHEGGKVQRLNGTGFTKLPSWSSLCVQPDAQLKTVVATSAAELKEAGIDVVLAPVVDVGGSTALGSRICSLEPTVVIKKATQLLAVYNQAGLLPVMKHFPGIGQANLDLHKNFDQVTINSEDASIYQQLLAQSTRMGVMVAPVGVKNQYPDIPCVLSPDCVAELSSNFPQVLVFTDALDMRANFHVSGGKPEPSLSEVAEQAIISGNQVLVFGPGVSAQQLTEVVDDLTKKYQTDPSFKTKTDLALEQIIKYKNMNR